MCLSVISKPQRWGDLGLLGLSSHARNIIRNNFHTRTVHLDNHQSFSPTDTQLDTIQLCISWWKNFDNHIEYSSILRAVGGKLVLGEAWNDWRGQSLCKQCVFFIKRIKCAITISDIKCTKVPQIYALLWYFRNYRTGFGWHYSLFRSKFEFVGPEVTEFFRVYTKTTAT
jgi:hypothetical protein